MQWYIIGPMALLGLIGGLISSRMPASGKAAVALGIVPLLGVWLGRWLNSQGFC